VKSQLSAAFEAENNVLMLVSGEPGRNQMKAAGHSKMQQHRMTIVDLKNQIFSPAMNPGKFMTFQSPAKLFWCRRSDGARPKHPGPFNCLSN